MRIGIVYDLKTDYTSESDTAFIDFESFDTFSRIKLILEKAGFNVSLIGEEYNIHERIQLITQCDIIFNFCEGYKSRNREALFPALYEKINVRFVGSDATACAITINKIMTKIIMQHLNITTPKWIEIRNDTNNSNEKLTLKFPRIIKPNCEGNSGGICIVHNITEQIDALKILTKRYDELLIEEYISGRKITVPIIGTGTDAKVLAIVETLDEHGQSLDFYDVKRKFNVGTIKVEASVSNETKNKIISNALKIYRYLGCRDYGRIDFRLSKHATPYLLELNLFPSLDHSSSFYHVANILKIDFSDIIINILKVAAKRLNIKIMRANNE